ncbi:MAG: hypothetical protein MJB14_11625 [Spirochaetes bacterium]|nr:hypothetical protein [Spirochaetota bacterium]
MTQLINSLITGVFFCFSLNQFLLFVLTHKVKNLYFAVYLFFFSFFVIFATDLHELLFPFHDLYIFIPSIILFIQFLLIFTLTNFMIENFSIPRNKIYYVYYFTQALLILIVTLILLTRGQKTLSIDELTLLFVVLFAIMITLIAVLMLSIQRNQSISKSPLIFYSIGFLLLIMLIQTFSAEQLIKNDFALSFVYYLPVFLLMNFYLIAEQIQSGTQDKEENVKILTIKDKKPTESVKEQQKVEKSQSTAPPVYQKPLPEKKQEAIEKIEEPLPQEEIAEKLQEIHFSQIIAEQYLQFEKKYHSSKMKKQIEQNWYMKTQRGKVIQLLDQLFPYCWQNIYKESLEMAVKGGGDFIEIIIGEIKIHPVLSSNGLNNIKLADIKRTVDQLQGKLVLLKNTQNDGAILKIQLPGYQIAASPKNHQKICFLVEENKDFLPFLTEMLNQQFSVHYSVTKEDALDTIQDIPKPLIIVADMKKMVDNDDFLFQVSKIANLSDVPILFLTKEKMKFINRVKDLREAKVDFLMKPITDADLNSKIKEMLSRQKNKNIRKIKEIESHLSAMTNRLDEYQHPNAEKFSEKCYEFGLTKDEINVALYLLEGLEYQQIAYKMATTEENIVESIQRIFKKSKITNRIDFINEMMK